ncbi:hypothetical protein BH11ACT8_BH11ACT8_35170 [soil metagenome]
MPWAPATSPYPPVEAAAAERLRTVDGAYVSPFERGEMRLVEGRRRWIRGAVHDADDVLLPGSQRVAGDPESPVAVDPTIVRRRKDVKDLDGTWLYGGHWMTHFGHFLVETLTTLWADPTERPDGLLLHRSYQGADPQHRKGVLLSPEPREWQATFLDLAGFGGLPIRVVQDRPVTPERIIVAARPLVFKACAGPDAVAAWERVAAATDQPGRGSTGRVFLSRSAFHQTRDSPKRVRSTEGWDTALDTAFATAGFAVVHPETLPLVEQIRLTRGAEVLAGASGSALHLSAFAGTGTRVIEVGDDRFSDAPGLTQRVIDAARGHTTSFVPYGPPESVAPALAELDL